ncbi:3-phosphoshikimate 1-carboxyvinyltransferase [Verrucomicrobiota bacterium]
MNLIIHQTQSLKGEIKAPPSKSYTHRAIIIASVNKHATVVNPSQCDDTTKTIEVWKKLGSKINIDRQHNQLDIRGFNGKPNLNGNTEFDVGESGTLMRFALPIISLAKGKFRVVGSGTLKTRPNREIVKALQDWGIDVKGKTDNHILPIIINAIGCLKGGEANIQDAQSSQFVSSLLIASPLAQQDTTIIVHTKLVSRPYVDITREVLKWAGVQVKVSHKNGRECFTIRKGQKFEPQTPFTVHGDYSGAAFLMAAAVLLKSDVTIADLWDDCQGDKAIIDILKRMGARIVREQNKVRITGPYELHGIDIDCVDTPDLVPLLVVLGCFAKGETNIRNIAHLKGKESNRIEQPARQLRDLGAKITLTDDSITVRHSELKSGIVNSKRDHRVAMALAIAALRIKGGLVIEGCECISKSYPKFVSDMKTIGVQLEEKDNSGQRSKSMQPVRKVLSTFRNHGTEGHRSRMSKAAVL